MGGSGGKTKSESTSTNKTPQQTQQLGEMIDLYAPAMGQNDKVWQGDRVAPMSGLQQGVLTGAQNYTGLFSDPKTAGMPLFNETGQATKNILSGNMGAKPLGQNDVNSYFQETMYQPTMTALKDDVLPMVDESYAGPGFWGSARAKGRQEAIQDTTDTLGQQYADLNWNVLQNNQGLEEAAASRAMSTIPSAMQYGQMPTENIRANIVNAASQVQGLADIFGLGKEEQTQEQAELQAEIVRFAEQNQITDPDDLAVMMSLLGMNFTTSTGSGSSWNISL